MSHNTALSCICQEQMTLARFIIPEIICM
uniref:Uncharacterized protein n=1 Tax=Anguilla anguilla TaxID=7936 RepID=A0A0E9PUE3_ANGAN